MLKIKKYSVLIFVFSKWTVILAERNVCLQPKSCIHPQESKQNKQRRNHYQTLHILFTIWSKVEGNCFYFHSIYLFTSKYFLEEVWDHICLASGSYLDFRSEGQLCVGCFVRQQQTVQIFFSVLNKSLVQIKTDHDNR